MRGWIVAAAIFFTGALTAAVAMASTSPSHAHRTPGAHPAGPNCARGHRCPARRPKHKPSKHHHHAANPMPGMVMPGGTMPAGSSMPSTPTPSSSSQPVAGSSGSSSTGTTGGGTPAPAPARLQVTAREFSLTLSRPSVPAGPVVIELVDLGQDAHNIHIQPAAGGADVAAFPTVQPGGHYDQQVTLAPGTYTVYCSMPYHEEMGMKVPLTVF